MQRDIIRGLPRTIEGATKRYLEHYENNFVGSAADMFRLRNMARDFIYRLRKTAPTFYEEKLPQLLNQAASTLLMFDNNDKKELKKFHETHAYLLLILQDLKDSQPAGEVNFQNEKKRYEERARLIKQQAALAKELDELEAVEFDFDEIGEEDYDTKYERVYSRIDHLRKLQREVNLKIAFIEGEQVEEKPHFELRVKPESILNRLTKQQQADLEGQMLEFYTVNNQKKTALYLDKSVIDGMIDRLGIDKSKFQLEELRQISKDALDAYKSYYREKDQALRDEFHKELLDNERLKPREGIILEDPECLPEDVMRRLNENSRNAQRETEILIEQFSTRQEIESAIEEQLDESGDEAAETNEEILAKLRSKGVQFSRVTEQPRDDYVESEEEVRCEDDDYNMDEDD